MKKNYGKRACAILAMTLAAVCFFSCSKKESSYVYNGKPEYKEAAELMKGKLRVGIECAYAPFNWTQRDVNIPGHPEFKAEPIFGSSEYAFGYDVIFSRMIADEMGLELEIHKNDWSSIFMGLKQSHDYDLIMSGIIYKEERDLSLDFTRAYYNRHNVIVVKKGGKYENAKSIDDFDGCLATTQINTNWPTYIAQIPNVVDKHVYPETCSEVIMQVAMGTVDIGVMDWPTAYSGCLANPDVCIVDFETTGGKGFVTPEGASEACSVAFDDTVQTQGKPNVLRDTFQAAMDAIGWDDEKMQKYMMIAIETMPLSN